MLVVLSMDATDGERDGVDIEGGIDRLLVTESGALIKLVISKPHHSFYFSIQSCFQVLAIAFINPIALSVEYLLAYLWWRLSVFNLKVKKIIIKVDNCNFSI